MTGPMSVSIVFLTLLIGVCSTQYPPTLNVPTSIMVAEDTAIDTKVSNINASDRNGEDVTFSVSSTAPVYIGNQTKSGSTFYADVMLKTKLDADTDPTSYTIIFNAANSAYTTPARMLLIITDVNDQKPTFTQPGYRVNVKESATMGSDVIQVSAKDSDQGLGGQVFYGLKAKGQNSEDYQHSFVITTRTGNITVNESLDYEERTFYQYNVTAWDTNPDEDNAGLHADPVDFFVTVLDVQDTPPFFRNIPYLKEIDENRTIGTSVLQVLAQDGDLGVPNPITYSIVDDDEDDGNLFHIIPESGWITTASVIDADSDKIKKKNGVLTFHVNASEVFEASQEQLGNTSSIRQVTVTIKDLNDNRPEFTVSPITASVDENMPVGVPVQLVTQVTVQDIDMDAKNNQFELTVKQDGNTYHDFDTIPREGQSVSETNIMIRVNNSALLDYEERTNVTFQIVAKESQSGERFSSVVEVVLQILNINDETPVFENNTYVFHIIENANVSDVVGQVIANDADVGSFGEVTYHMSDPDGAFTISENDGSISVNGELDRESKALYSLTAYAIDNDTDPNGQRTGETRIEIHIDDFNDNDPEFDPMQDINLSEDINVGVVVTTVRATDKDDGLNAEIVYSLSGEQTNASGKFAVDNTTGEVIVQESLIGFSGTRVILIEAHDRGTPPRSGSLTLVFHIRDVNLNPPYFTIPDGNFNVTHPFIFHVFEEEDLGTLMFTFNASDEDKGLNGNVTYGIEPGSNSYKFNINHTSGQLTNQDRLDREWQANYTIQIAAQDRGTPTLKTTLPVLVVLWDIDDNDPYFPEPEYSSEIEEEQIGCLAENIDFAKDRDEWENNTRRCYYIQGGTQPYVQYISFNRTTGTMCLTQKLDREKVARLDMLVMVSRDCDLSATPENNFNESFDRNNRSFAHIIIKVKDINDNPPEFEEAALSTGILYDVGVNQEIYDLRDVVTDADEGENAITEFNDLGQTSDIEDIGDAPFNVTRSGIITTNRLFSSNKLGYVEISVEAIDKGNYSLKASANLKIYIISNIQRVKIIFNDEPENVRKFQKDFIEELMAHLDYTIIVEKIAQHERSDKSTVEGRTDMFIHAVYDSGEYVPASQIWKDFDFTPGIAVVFSKYGVTETSPVIDQETTDDDLSRKLTMGIILVAVILTLITISLATALFCIRQKYARRLRAERTSTDTYLEKESPPPGTNLYTASNPIFMKKAPNYEADEDNISLDLDDNAVDTLERTGGLDEQEMTLDIQGPDAFRAMTSNSVLDDVLSRYAEVEKAKSRGDKQTLIEEHSSDGDSGSFHPVQNLEHTDI